MKITEVSGDRWAYRDLLLLADPSEEMIGRYLPHGFLLAAYESGAAIGVLSAVPVESGWELKNIAVAPAFQRRGVGRALIDAALARLPAGTRVLVGTGETPASFAFYSACGFTLSHRVKNFFTDNYPQPIWDDGVLLTDMVYFVRLF